MIVLRFLRRIRITARQETSMQIKITLVPEQEAIHESAEVLRAFAKD